MRFDYVYELGYYLNPQVNTIGIRHLVQKIEIQSDELEIIKSSWYLSDTGVDIELLRDDTVKRIESALWTEIKKLLILYYEVNPINEAKKIASCCSADFIDILL